MIGVYLLRLGRNWARLHYFGPDQFSIVEFLGDAGEAIGMMVSAPGIVRPRA